MNFSVDAEVQNVATTFYTVDGGNATEGNQVVIGQEGVHTISYWTVFEIDGSQYVEPAKQLAVKLDKTDPQIAVDARTPAANEHGWNRSPVTVTYAASDALSGVDTVAGGYEADIVTGEGAGQSTSGSVTDKAGNSASVTVTGINIDLTDPTVVSFSPADGDTVEDARPLIEIVFADVLSGVATGAVTLAVDGANVTASADATVTNIIYTPPADLEEGKHTVAIALEDLAGNACSNQIAFTIAALEPEPDTDGDGLPDPWELQYWGNLDQTATDDSEGDGLNNLTEYENGSDPTRFDGDGDGFPDWMEIERGTDPADPQSFPQPNLYVDISAPPGGDGSQGSPLNTLQSALDLAGDGDIVQVADGVYSGPGNKDLNFQGKSITLVSANGPDACIVDAGGSGVCFSFASGEDRDTVLSQMTIMGGGYGVECLNSHPTIIGCVFTNSSWAGAYCDPSTPAFAGCHFDHLPSSGIALEDSSPTLQNCTFRNNQYDGIEAWYSSPVIRNCIITGNGQRGILVYGANTMVVVDDCTISGNGWEGITSYDSSLTIRDCALNNNHYGGIVYYDSALTIEGSHISNPNSDGIYGYGSTVTLRNSRFLGNRYNGIYCADAISLLIENCVSSGNREDGIDCRRSTGVLIQNCTVVGNTWSGVSSSTTSPTIRNSIIWGNGYRQIDAYWGSSPTVTYSCIQGGWSGDGNIADNPQFDPAEPYHLTQASPCIDAGTLDGAPDLDIDTDYRWDDPDAGNVVSIVDIGADEFIPLPEPAGVHSFGSFRRGTVIPLPNDFRDKLDATHLLIPPDCQLDDKENRTFCLVKMERPDPDWRLVDQNGVVCRELAPDMYEGAWWTAYRVVLNLFRWAFGLPPMTAESMYEDVLAGHGIVEEEVGQGKWWETPEFSKLGRYRFYLEDKEGKRLRKEPAMTILVRQPIRIDVTRPTDGKARRFERFEADITLDKGYFHHLSPAANSMTPQDRFDAYDADHDGEKIIVDAVFTLMSGGENDVPVDKDNDGNVETYNVPCFCMKDAYNSDFEWKVRFSPPFATTSKEYWDLKVRAAVWHDKKGDTPENYDEFNQVAVPGYTGPGDGQTYYHYYGWNDIGKEVDGLPDATGNQHANAAFYDGTDPLTGGTYDSALPPPRIKFRCDAGTEDGPLETPKATENKFYLHHLKKAGATYSRKPFFVLGMARPWAVPREYNEPPWGTEEVMNRQTQLYPQMTAARMNFNYTWFAPWETQITHRKQKEFWFSETDPTAPVIEHDPSEGWAAYSYYDQGRAKRMDKIIEGHEANDIYMALTVWAHQSLQVGEPGVWGHPWGETGYDFKRRDEQETGFSALIPNIDNFFKAAHDLSGANWLWQKNLYRYVVARYGYSRILAAWVTIDELEGVGDSYHYWWRHADDTEKWHDALLEVLHELDWMKRPTTASTTYWGRSRESVADRRNPYTYTEVVDWGHCYPYNTWTGAGEDPFVENMGPQHHGDWVGNGEKIHMLSLHNYHLVFHPENYGDDGDHCGANWGRRVWANILPDQQALLWHYSVARIHTWARSAADQNRPYLVTEYGMYERDEVSQDQDIDPKVMRSYLHFAIWSAFANGHAGTPLKWCDGKQFGEMFPRGNGIFKAAEYPDLREEMSALQKLVTTEIEIASLTERFTASVEAPGGGPSSVRAFGIKGGAKYVVWLFDDDFNATWGDNWGKSTRTYASNQKASKSGHTLVIGDVPNPEYSITRFNTWNGTKATDPDPIARNADGKLHIPVGEFGTDADHPNETWDGGDILLIVE